LRPTARRDVALPRASGASIPSQGIDRITRPPAADTGHQGGNQSRASPGASQHPAGSEICTPADGRRPAHGPGPSNLQEARNRPPARIPNRKHAGGAQAGRAQAGGDNQPDRDVKGREPGAVSRPESGRPQGDPARPLQAFRCGQVGGHPGRVRNLRWRHWPLRQRWPSLSSQTSRGIR